MKNSNEHTKSYIAEMLPFKTQIFGGFCKAEVIEYVEQLAASIEHEKIELEGKKQSILNLMEKGQMFSDQLIKDAKNQAEIILKDAKREAEQQLKNAEEEVVALQVEHNNILDQCQYDTNHLIELYTRKYEETREAYEQMLKPLKELSETLRGRKKEFEAEKEV